MKKTSSSGNGSLTINESRTMKKIYSLMVAAVALFAAASCNKEISQEQLPVGETVVYTASVDGADTKAVLNETTKKSEWVANDAITVLDGTKDWTFTTEAAGHNVEFSNSEGFGDYRPVLAVYPKGTYTANIAEKTVNAYIPTFQGAREGTYNESAALAVAYSEGSDFAFKNAHALLKFTVNTDNVTHVIFHGNGSEAITGDVSVTLGKEGVESVKCLETVFTSEKWNDETQQKEQVSETKYGTWVECYAWNDINNTPDNYDDDIKCFVKGQTYYIAVAPQKFEGGVTVKVRINEGEELVAKSTTKPVETKVNTILDLGEIEYEAPVVHEWAIAGTFNGWNTSATPMVKEGDYYVARNITGLNFTEQADKEESATGFKFVQNGDVWKGSGENGGVMTVGSWSWIWGDNGSNICVNGASAETAYDIYLNPSQGEHGKFVIVAVGDPMPEDKPAEEPEVTVDYWTVAGSFNGWSSTENQMTLVDDWYVVENIKMVANDQFKFCADGGWDVNRGAEGAADGVVIENNVETAVVQGGKNFAVSEGGFYSLYLNKAANKAKVVKTAELPVESVPDQPSEWALAGTFNSWADAAMVTTTVPDLFVIKNVALDAYAELKVKKKASGADNGWGTSYGSASVNYLNKNIWISVASGGANVSVVNSGKYDVYFDLTNKKLYLMASGVAYDSATEQTTNGAAPVIIDGKVIYLDTNIWGTNANFTAWVWGESDKWVTFEPTDEAGIYSAVVPKGTTHMIFLRKDPNHSLTSWDCWNRTGNETIGSNNCFRVTDWNGHKDNGSYSKGTWSNR